MAQMMNRFIRAGPGTIFRSYGAGPLLLNMFPDT